MNLNLVRASFATEFLKLRRSKVTWATLAAFSIAPLAIALFMWIVREPGRAAQLGLLGTKANLSGLEATWPSYVSMLTLVVGVGGMLLLAFIVAYVFGREYAEGTAKNLLVLPIARHWFVLAKLIVAAVWWFALVSAILAETFAIGFALGLPGYSAALAATTVRDVALVAGAAFLLAPPIAWITVLGQGYMPPIGFALATGALGDVFTHTGWGAWFPWAIVPMFVGAVGERQAAIAPGSIAVVALTFLLGIGATIAQLRWADNAQ
jgi:ABC-2 type transport system permease protein